MYTGEEETVRDAITLCSTFRSGLRFQHGNLEYNVLFELFKEKKCLIGQSL